MRALYETMHREIEAIDGADLEDAEIHARCGRVNEMRDRLSETPARTLDDVAVKLCELNFVIREWGMDTISAQRAYPWPKKPSSGSWHVPSGFTSRSRG